MASEHPDKQEKTIRLLLDKDKIKDAKHRRRGSTLMMGDTIDQINEEFDRKA